MNHPPRKGDEIPGATLSLISVSLMELQKDVAQLLETNWPEPLRRRAHELASALRDACAREGLEELSRVIASMACLAALPQEKASPLRPQLRAKFDELLDGARKLVAAGLRRRIG